jgi:hypothetical protein
MPRNGTLKNCTFLIIKKNFQKKLERPKFVSSSSSLTAAIAAAIAAAMALAMVAAFRSQPRRRR